MAEHLIEKPEKIVNIGVGLLYNELVIPNLFTKKNFLDYAGSKDDTLNMVVEGLLPFREYAWRNDRSSPIQFDRYTERKIAVTLGGNVYSAVEVTDEQYTMDLDGWGKLMGKQAQAVGRGLQYRAVDKLVNAPYEVTIGGAEADLYGAIVEARRVLNAFRVPTQSRVLFVGTDFETELLTDKRFTLAQNAGDSRAESALASATIGSIAGFGRIVVDQSIPADMAYAADMSGFVFASAVPKAPLGAPYASTASFEGIGLRWVCDYDPKYQQDRSVVNTFAGFQYVPDNLVGVNAQGNEFVTAQEYFVRGVRLSLDGANDYPAAGSELATVTKVSDAKVWTPKPV